jgi:hypothetical protein
MVGMAELRDGMKVRTLDGHDLGRIVRLDAGILVVEKGIFFREEHEVPASFVSEVLDDEAHLSVSKEALEREGGLAAAAREDEGAAPIVAAPFGRGGGGDARWNVITRRRPGEVRAERRADADAGADARREAARAADADADGEGRGSPGGASGEDEASRAGYGTPEPDER